MLVDFYEMTMANGYLKNGMGTPSLISTCSSAKCLTAADTSLWLASSKFREYLKGLKFTHEDIEYLRGKGFSEEFLDYLADFKFSCDVYAVPEGT